MDPNEFSILPPELQKTILARLIAPIFKMFSKHLAFDAMQIIFWRLGDPRFAFYAEAGNFNDPDPTIVKHVIYNAINKIAGET
jgi:hypothetical protein